jgi:multiple sugar transport system substrate-binding protein
MSIDITRRTVLTSAAGLGAGLVTAGRPRRAFAQSPVTLTLSVWAGKAESDGFNALIAKYQAKNPNVTIRLEIIPFGQFYQSIDTRLAGRQAPDVFRVTYPQIGRYAMAKGAVDLSGHIDADYGKAFTPAIWDAVNYQGKPYALPHHTDTLALFYNIEALEKIGVQVPTKLDDAWTWARFIEVARALKAKSIGNFPFASAWQNGSSHRWLIYLYQHGGRLLGPNFDTVEADNAAGIETVAWTQSWFKEGLVPPSSSVKSSEAIQNLFVNGTIPLMIYGNWQIPFVEQQAKFKWGVTYLPRDIAMADDMGGTCLAVSRDTKNRDTAIDFVKFVASEEAMREFVDIGQFLPVRTALVNGGQTYRLRPDEMKVFVNQTTTIPSHLARTITHPAWGKFNPRLTDELDLAFTSGQAADVTAKNIAAHVRNILLPA